MARQKTPAPPWNDVTNDGGQVIGRWRIEGGMLRVAARNGGSRSARPSSGSNETLARIMLSEPWARS